MITAQSNQNIGQVGDSFGDAREIGGNILNADIPEIADAQPAQARAVFAERRKMARPLADTLWTQRRPQPGAGQAIERQTQHAEICFSGGDIGPVQISPECMCTFNRHLTYSFRRIKTQTGAAGASVHIGNLNTSLPNGLMNIAHIFAQDCKRKWALP